jgi:hypothetical protein
MNSFWCQQEEELKPFFDFVDAERLEIVAGVMLLKILKICRD